MKDDLELGILIPRDLTSPEYGRVVFETLAEFFPQALPERYGSFEPLDKEFAGSDFQPLLESWENPFFWERRRPHVDGSIWFGMGKRHSCHHLTLESKRIDINAALQYMKAIFQRIGGDYAYLHVFSLDELKDQSRYERVMAFRRGVATTDLYRGLPDVTSVIILGEPYLEMFGKERVMSSPAAITEELSDRGILLQVCSDPKDSQTSFLEFDRQRESLKEHLGTRAFFRSGAGDRIEVPDFRFV